MLKFELIGCAPGLAFSLRLRARVRRALGRVLTLLLLGLLRLLLRCHYHLIHDILNGRCYMNAYEIIECSSMMQLLYFNWNALRTVRTQVVDRPQYNSADPPEPTNSLDKFSIYTADCPLSSSGLSAVNSAKPPEATTPLDKF